MRTLQRLNVAALRALPMCGRTRARHARRRQRTRAGCWLRHWLNWQSLAKPGEVLAKSRPCQPTCQLVATPRFAVVRVTADRTAQTKGTLKRSSGGGDSLFHGLTCGTSTGLAEATQLCSLSEHRRAAPALRAAPGRAPREAARRPRGASACASAARASGKRSPRGGGGGPSAYAPLPRGTITLLLLSLWLTPGPRVTQVTGQRPHQGGRTPIQRRTRCRAARCQHRRRDRTTPTLAPTASLTPNFTGWRVRHSSAGMYVSRRRGFCAARSSQGARRRVQLHPLTPVKGWTECSRAAAALSAQPHASADVQSMQVTVGRALDLAISRPNRRVALRCARWP